MSKLVSYPAVALAVVLLVALADRAAAQQSTTATYGDWVVHCAMQLGTPPQNVCDMEQLTGVKGKNEVLSRVAISRPTKGEAAKLVVQLPVNVWIATGVKIQVDNKDSGLAGQFNRCIPAGCFAMIAMKDDVLQRLSTTSAPARVVFKNAGQREIAIPLSFNGFGHALNALQAK